MSLEPRVQPNRSASHGRGGAGNIGAREDAGVQVDDLRTPTIKGATYTTGRGGSGNMVSNDPSNPTVARAAQDVDTPAAHKKEAQGAFHWGRGGEGNLMTVGGGNKDKPKERKTSKGAGDRRNSLAGVIEKGKEILGVNNKKKESANANESAVLDG